MLTVDCVFPIIEKLMQPLDFLDDDLIVYSLTPASEFIDETFVELYLQV